MNYKKSISFLILSALLLMNNAAAFAQCSVCRTSLESDLKNGGSIGTGLNTGILYLMAIPYVFLMIGGYFFFKKPIDAKLKAWKEKRFPRKQAN